MSGMSPTQLSLRHLKAQGYVLVEVVEHKIPHSFISKDLFGLFDILALKGDETVGVQTTSVTNVNARMNKMADSPNIAAVREAGWTIKVHGWAKNKSNQWQLKRDEDLS